MRRRTLVLLAINLGTLSCSAADGQAPPAAPSDSATLISPSSVIQATIDGSRIFGPQIELTCDANGMRGRGPLGIVDLRKTDGSIRGVVGGGPTELYLEPEGENGFALRGLFSAVLGHLEVKQDRIQGQLGRCQYNLRRYVSEESVAYTGQRICGRGYVEPTTFTLSPGIAALEPIDRAALIAVLLGH
jgi:hypothetical protein